MKKLLGLVMALALMISCLTAALADGNAIICVGCKINGQTRLNFAGTQTFTAIADGSGVIQWKLNGRVQDGINADYIVFTANTNTVVEAVYSSEGVTPEQSPAPAPIDVTGGECKVTAVGCHLQYLNANGVGDGTSYTEIDFTDSHINPNTGDTQKGGAISFKVSADNPHGSQIAYWVIDGAKYDFQYAVKFITVKNLKHSMSFEVVYKNKDSVTMPSAEEIQAGRGGEKRVVQTVSAQLALIQGKSTRIGDYTKEFDFTDDYKNPKTGDIIKGGSCDIVVAAFVNKDKDQHVSYWKFDDTTMVFSTRQDNFRVYGLYFPIVYTARVTGGNEAEPAPSPFGTN